MSFEPLIAQGFPISWHAFAAIAALLIGATQFALPKGTMRHRTIGYFWAALMMLVAGSSLWIHQNPMVGQFNVLHLLSIWVLIAVPLIVWHAHRHRVSRHRGGMISLYMFGLIGAGLFTLLPGRIMHTVVFGP